MGEAKYRGTATMASCVHAHVGLFALGLSGRSTGPTNSLSYRFVGFLMPAGVCPFAESVYLALAQRKSISPTPPRIDAFHSDG